MFTSSALLRVSKQIFSSRSSILGNERDYCYILYSIVHLLHIFLGHERSAVFLRSPWGWFLPSRLFLPFWEESGRQSWVWWGLAMQCLRGGVEI